ncbi:MAG: Rho-binding antiterminator [Bacteroidota bacterium]|nr:Rho-binding antiterminator [Bacteroidota bacterium]
MSPAYTPIDCHFYDRLEAAATQRRRVALQYFNDLRQLCLDSGVIDTFFIREKVEYLRLKSGEEIRLDHLICLDDTPAPLYADYPDFSGGC